MNNNVDNFKGAYTALVTPFTADASKVDFESLANLIDDQIDNQVSGIVVCGSTGESATLSIDEYYEVIKFTITQVAGKVPVIAGIGTNSTHIACQIASNLKEYKLYGLLIVTPPYNKPPQRGVVEHFQHIKIASKGMPLIAYNIPGRSALNLTAETIHKLAKDSLISAVKESSGNMEQVLDIIRLCKDKIAILSGEDALVHATMASGGHGTISASQNVLTKEFVQIVNSNLQGDTLSSANTQLDILEKVRALYLETNPIPVKVVLSLKKIISYPSVRLPLVSALPTTVEQIKQTFNL